MATTDDVLLLSAQGPVLIAELNRPDARNALDASLIHALGDALLSAETDPALRAVVLTNTGDRTFCAGMDLRSFSGSGFGAVGKEQGAAFQRLMRGQIDVPMIGAANGTALAGGFELLLGCDLIVLAQGAKLGLPEVRRGLFAVGAVQQLAGRLPLGLALELALTGEPLTSERAGEIGLVNAVVPSDEVLPVARSYAERIAANGPLALTATKQIMRAAGNDAAAAAALLAEWQPTVFGSADAKEGATAFLEKRDPVWLGR